MLRAKVELHIPRREDNKMNKNSLRDRERERIYINGEQKRNQNPKEEMKKYGNVKK
jgi:hypothetical protein